MRGFKLITVHNAKEAAHNLLHITGIVVGTGYYFKIISRSKN